MSGDVDTFGEALGLHPDFLRDVSLRGQIAIIDRADMVDVNGAQGRLLAMVQHVAMSLQGKMARDQAPKQGEIMDTIAFFADRYGVEKQQAMHLVGAALETFQQTSRRVAMGGSDKEEPRKNDAIQTSS